MQQVLLKPYFLNIKCRLLILEAMIFCQRFERNGADVYSMSEERDVFIADI